MAVYKGQATDYQNLLDLLVAFTTEDYIDTVAVNAGGTGYILTEILTVSGGTATVAASFEVSALGVSASAINAGGTGYVASEELTVVGGTGTAAILTISTVDGSGTITGISVTTDGSYTTLPTNPVSVTGGSGSGATFNLTVDIVTAVRYNNAGAYTSNPSSPVSTTASGSGTGCTLTVTFDDNGWLVQRNATVSGEQEVILKGIGSGSDEIYVGVRTFRYVPSDVYNWELAGFTGFDSGLDWENQAGISPGRYEDEIDNGAYVPLGDQAINYWFFINSRRIMGVFKIGTSYPNMYLGFLNPYATTSEYPYPLYVAGCTDSWDTKFSDNILNYSGLSDPIGWNDATVNTAGPGYIRSTDGQWYQVANSESYGTTRNACERRNVMPCGSNDGKNLLPEPEDEWYLEYAMNQFIPNTGNPGIQYRQLRPTLDTGGDLHLMFPSFISMADPSQIFLGELEGVYWFNAVGSVVTEQTIEYGGDYYLIFQNCLRTEDWAFFAIKEE